MNVQISGKFVQSSGNHATAGIPAKVKGRRDVLRCSCNFLPTGGATFLASCRSKIDPCGFGRPSIRARLYPRVTKGACSVCHPQPLAASSLPLQLFIRQGFTLRNKQETASSCSPSLPPALPPLPPAVLPGCHRNLAQPIHGYSIYLNIYRIFERAGSQ